VERTLLTRAIVGELQVALADCNEALRLKPDVDATLDSRGLTYLKMGQWDSAIDDYSSALRFDPKLASSLYGRGLAKLKKGDVIPNPIDQNPWAHWRSPMDMMRQG